MPWNCSLSSIGLSGGQDEEAAHQSQAILRPRYSMENAGKIWEINKSIHYRRPGSVPAVGKSGSVAAQSFIICTLIDSITQKC